MILELDVFKNEIFLARNNRQLIVLEEEIQMVGYFFFIENDHFRKSKFYGWKSLETPTFCMIFFAWWRPRKNEFLDHKVLENVEEILSQRKIFKLQDNEWVRILWPITFLGNQTTVTLR